MKILSRRSSGVKKEEEETYVVIKNHVAKSVLYVLFLGALVEFEGRRSGFGSAED